MIMDSRLNAIRLQSAISFKDLLCQVKKLSLTLNFSVSSKLNKRRLFRAVMFLNEPRQCFKWAPKAALFRLAPSESRAGSQRGPRHLRPLRAFEPALYTRSTCSMPRVSIQTQVVPRLDPLPLTRRVFVCESEAER